MTHPLFSCVKSAKTSGEFNDRVWNKINGVPSRTVLVSRKLMVVGCSGLLLLAVGFTFYQRSMAANEDALLVAAYGNYVEREDLAHWVVMH